MKTTLLVLTVAGLSGCAVYPASPTYSGYPTYGDGPPLVLEQPVYIEGVYQRRDYPRVYSRPSPVVVVPAPRVFPPGPPPHASRHERHHRHGHGQRDHDGDGTRDRADRWPHDPYRR